MTNIGSGLRCLIDLVFPRSCVACGAPGANACVDCIATGDPAPERGIDGLSTVASAFLHTGVPRDLLLAAKLGGERREAASLAEMLPAPAVSVATVASVPDSFDAMASRGGSLTRSLARRYAKHHRLIHRDLLVRRGSHRDLGGASRAEREVAVRDVFRAHGPCLGEVILIDDVVTTGATAAACARELLQAGASAVHLVTFTSSVNMSLERTFHPK